MRRNQLIDALLLLGRSLISRSIHSLLQQTPFTWKALATAMLTLVAVHDTLGVDV